MNGDKTTHIDWSDVQGLLHSGYPGSPHSRYIFVKFNENQSDVKAFLGSLAHRISYSLQSGTGKAQYSQDRQAEMRVFNIAFSASGLRKAGLAKNDLKTFPFEFMQGMHSERASRVLGDTERNCPDNWRWGNSKNAVDAVIIAYHKDNASIDSFGREICTEITAHSHRVVCTVESVLEARDALGLTDGLSNPVIKGRQTAVRRHRVDPGGLVNPGEFLCGHINERRQVSACPSVGPGPAAFNTLLPSTGQRMYLGDQKNDCYSFGMNGSYLVMRQLKENVEAFEHCIDMICKQDNELNESVKNMRCKRQEANDFVKAKLIGRWPDGTTLIDAPTIEIKRSLNATVLQMATRNDFGFRDNDRDGCLCPFGAHIRRAFPRDALSDSAESSYRLSNRRRLLRRGRNYYSSGKHGSRDVADRKPDGLMFVCFNADIGKQFEFVQGSWLNGEKFAGPEPEIDPLIGVQSASSARFSVQNRPVRRIYGGLEQFVTVLGGGYFFLPGRRAINYLIHHEPQ